MMAKRGVQVTYETVREWCLKFGSLYALLLRRKRARIGSKWHLDEVFIQMNGVQHYLSRVIITDKLRSRELTSTNPSTRKTNEALSIFGSSSMLPLYLRISQRSFSI